MARQHVQRQHVRLTARLVEFGDPSLFRADELITKSLKLLLALSIRYGALTFEILLEFMIMK